MLPGFDKLTILGFTMVATFMVLIMTKRLSALIALIVVPVAFALIGGFAGEMGGMMLDGIRNLAPTGVMLMFAILYFGVMNDAGLFDPLIGAILRLAKGDPLRVLLGTAVLTLLVSLDGDGSTTYIIVITAMLPLYQRLGLNPLFLSGIAMLAVGVTNILPWGGPTARAASALHIDPNDIFTPMIPALLGCMIWVALVACLLGLWERRRLGRLSLALPVGADLETESATYFAQGALPPTLTLPLPHSGINIRTAPTSPIYSPSPIGRRDVDAFGTAVDEGGGDSNPVSKELKEDGRDSNPLKKEDSGKDNRESNHQERATLPPRVRLAVNAALTLLLLASLVMGVFPMPVLFMLAFALALIINYPDPEAQKERIAAHARSVLSVVGLIFAAGIFTGILSGTKMVDAMTHTILALVSSDMGPHLSAVTAIISLPLTFLLSNDAFYFGMLPILSKAAASYGITAAEMGRASIVGQPVHFLSPLVPSSWLLVSLSRVEWSDHQRFTLLWAMGSCLVMLLIAWVAGVIPL